MQLSEIIIEKIRKEGPISFRDFMEMALYYPELGYYTSSSEKIGKGGDYFTSADLTPLLGAMIARQLEEMWYLMDRDNFTLIEYGAGMGNLCNDILHALERNGKMYDQLNYYIIEKSPVMRKHERFLSDEKVSWINSISDLEEITGCVLTNEVIDNFSVHQVVMDEELMEVFVDYPDNFKEILKPASDELKNYFSELNVILPKGFRAEINLEAVAWIAEIAKALKKGFVLTIDYGYSASELTTNSRRLGSLICYRKHGVSHDVYDNIGNQDITAHVNFSALNHWGMKNGLTCCGFTDQAHFLHGLGIAPYLEKAEGLDKERMDDQKVFMLHTLLMSMGRRFKVLIQQKGLQVKGLSGLRFADYFV